MAQQIKFIPGSYRLVRHSKKGQEMPTKKKVEKVVESAVHAVPMAEREPRKHSKVVDRFRTKVKPKTKEVPERPVIDIDDETKEKFVAFAATKELFDIFEASKKRQTADIYSAVFEKYKDALWRSKSQPKNPSIKVEYEGKLEAEGQFIVQVGSKVKVQMPEVGEDELPEEVMLAALKSLGISSENAERLIEREVSFVPQWSLNFTDMLHGTIIEGKLEQASESQVSASELLFQVINGQDEDGNDLGPKTRVEMLRDITSEGWSLIKNNIDKHTKYFPQLVDGANFLDRVCDYADSREELDSILTMFCPVHFCQRVRFACSDTEEMKNGRLLEEAKSEIVKEDE